jgi:hypothetical protein
MGKNCVRFGRLTDAGFDASIDERVASAKGLHARRAIFAGPSRRFGGIMEVPAEGGEIK